MAKNNNNNDGTSEKNKSSKRKYTKEQEKARQDTVRAIKTYYGSDVDPKIVNSILANVEVESSFLESNLRENPYKWNTLKTKPGLVSIRKKVDAWGGTKEQYDKLSDDEKLSVMYWGDTDHSETAGGRGAIQLTSAGYGGNHKTDDDLKAAAEELGLDLGTIHNDFYNSTLATLKVYDNRGQNFIDYADSPSRLRSEVVNPREKLDKNNDKDAAKIATLSYYDSEESFFPEINEAISKGTQSIDEEAIRNHPGLDDSSKEELARMNESEGLEPSTAQSLLQKPSILESLGYMGTIKRDDMLPRDTSQKQARMDDAMAKKNKKQDFGYTDDINTISPTAGLQENGSRKFERGGSLMTEGNSNVLTEYNEGGSHGQNPHGGVGVGMNSQGGKNLVEQGETRHNDYIYSNHYQLSKEDAERFNLNPKLAGKNYSDISKEFGDEMKQRPYDNIVKRTAEGNLNKLMLAQESIRQKEQMDAANSSSGEVQPNAQFMFGGGMSGQGAGLMANMGAQAGQAMQSDDNPAKMQGWESMKDMAAQSNPYMAAFRAVEQMGKGIGNAIGGEKGENVATGIVDPLSTQMGTLKHEDATTMEKVGSVALPFASGAFLNKAEKRKDAREARDQSYIENNKFTSTFKNGGLLDSYLNKNDPPFGIRNIFDNQFAQGNIPSMATNPITPQGQTDPSSEVVQLPEVHISGPATARDNGYVPGLLVQPHIQEMLNKNANAVQGLNNVNKSGMSPGVKSSDSYANSDTPDTVGSSSNSDDRGTTLKSMNPGELLRYAGVAGNIGQLLFGDNDPEVETYDKLGNRYQRQMVDERMLENRVSNSAANTRNALKDTYGGSAATARASLLASGLNETKGLSEAMMRAQGINRDENTRAQQFNLGVDSTNQRVSIQETIANAQNRSAADDYKKQLLNATLQDFTSMGKESRNARILENVTGYNTDGTKDGSRGQGFFADLIGTNGEDNDNLLRSIANMIMGEQ